jgi:hypothetical protein
MTGVKEGQKDKRKLHHEKSENYMHDNSADT